MKHKILNIQGCKTAKQALATACRNDDGEDLVEISIWHTTTEGEFYQLVQVFFDNSDLAQSFVEDYSNKSASKLANSFKINS